ncbi:MAG: hypothetical protein Q8L88_00295 [Bacteroidota bacterium]|nr:hypothetical protein [Bacteroidota bacterium]
MMQKNLSRFVSLSVCVMIIAASLQAQQYFIDPSKGNIVYTKKGILDGNLIRTLFYNHGEIAYHSNHPSGEWPKGTGHEYLDGVAVIVQAEVKDKNNILIHPLETNYREFIRKDPVSKIPWGWEPLPGYANAIQDEPAMSNKSSTWPSRWPDRSTEWNGLWNGFFGRGILNADLETYFRMDDAADKQYQYFPDPSDSSRGGLGLQVAVRGFQWSQVLAADVIFWYYEITNVAQQDYSKVVFAQYIDWGIGGTDDSSDDRGLFDKELDIAYAFDGDGIGSPGSWSPVGVAGYAFLESPGITKDSLGVPQNHDDDDDGITDESRENDAGTKITGKSNVIAAISAQVNTTNFLRFYNYTKLDDLPAVQQGYWWTGDENANWRGFTDLNADGDWDDGEPLNDDVGSDGLAPLDPNYLTPDADGSQGNGRPEQGEPSFGSLDKDESDQIGLTGFNIFPVHFYELHNDEQNWNVLTTETDTAGLQQLNDVNLGMYFSAGARSNAQTGFSGNLFPLRKLQTERFSMALLFGDDRNDLIRRKKTVQQIYNANYRFAKPPDKPLVVAVPGNHKVTLYWDSHAEQSYDPFLQQFDFEGYRIYRSTESSFLENLVITDAYGKQTFRKPLAQFDLVDSIKGLHPLDINGVKFDLGTDSGLRHTYIDNDVQNGQTYYYAVVSYDRGFYVRTLDGKDDGIAPSECTAIIRTDLSGNSKPDINTAVVTPRAPSAGYVSPGVDGGILHSGPGTGSFGIEVLNPDSVKSGHLYRITFQNNSAFQNNPKPSFSITDETNGIVQEQNKIVVGNPEESSIIDGFIGYVRNDGSIAVLDSEWKNGNSNVTVKINSLEADPAYSAVAVKYPADYEIRYSNQIVDSSTQTGFFDPLIPTKFTIWNTTENKKAQFILIDTRNDSSLAPGNKVIIIAGDTLGKPAQQGNYRAAWKIEMFIDTLAGPLKLPQPNDIYSFATAKPFRTGESFQFKMKGSNIDGSKAKSDLDKVAVVPNPYVGAASWEPQNLFRTGRGERRIQFINLPAKCTIRIYSVAGNLVNTLQHNADIDNGQMPWDLVSKDGMDISYGIYIFHVDAPGIGEKIGKFAVVK